MPTTLFPNARSGAPCSCGWFYPDLKDIKRRCGRGSITSNEDLPDLLTSDGHVAFVKPSRRFEGVARMRVVLDKVVTPDEDPPELICGFALVWAG